MNVNPALSWQQQAQLWWDDLLLRLDFKSVDLMRLALYGGVSFIIGFLIKRYFRSLFIGILLSLVLIGFLHYTQIITLDFAKLNALLGLSADRSLESYLHLATSWVKDNVVLALSIFIGFIIGYKAA